MKYIIIFPIALLSFLFSQNSQLDIDGNSALQILEGSKICVDDLTVQQGSSLWAYDYGQIKKSDCTVILSPTGNGTVTLPVEIADSETLPLEFTVDTAYPNPFNPVTNIKYGIPGRSSVRIILYDIQGHLINELYNDHQEAGWYTISWNGLLTDGSIAPAGIYFMKLSSSSDNGTEFKSIKISLIK